MRGAYEVVIENNKVQYKFKIERNITILKGNSATGKTTLISLVEEYMRNGIKSGVNLSCKKKCMVLSGDYWREQIRDNQECIMFIDEDSEFVASTEFAGIMKDSDHYYVIASRDTLSCLPYSVEEIYELTNVTKGYGKIKKMYTHFKRVY